jgi:hypothetical protein
LAQPRHPGEAAEVGLDKLVEVLKRPDLVAHEPLATTKQSVSAQSLWPLGLLLFSVKMPNAQAKQCIAATPSTARAFVVKSSDRRTTVLVQTQAHASEIVVGMAQSDIRAIRFQRRSYMRRH